SPPRADGGPTESRLPVYDPLPGDVSGGGGGDRRRARSLPAGGRGGRTLAQPAGRYSSERRGRAYGCQDGMAVLRGGGGRGELGMECGRGLRAQHGTELR